MSLYTYRRWEENLSRPPGVKLKGMYPHEHFVVLRIRSGLGISELARRIGITRSYLWFIESGKGPLAKLIDYWS